MRRSLRCPWGLMIIRGEIRRIRSVPMYSRSTVWSISTASACLPGGPTFHIFKASRLSGWRLSLATVPSRPCNKWQPTLQAKFLALAVLRDKHASPSRLFPAFGPPSCPCFNQTYGQQPPSLGTLLLLLPACSLWLHACW